MFLRIKFFFILRNNLLYRKEGQLTIVNSIKKAEQSQMIVCRVVGPINPELYKFDFMTYYQTLQQNLSSSCFHSFTIYAIQLSFFTQDFNIFKSTLEFFGKFLAYEYLENMRSQALVKIVIRWTKCINFKKDFAPLCHKACYHVQAGQAKPRLHLTYTTSWWISIYSNKQYQYFSYFMA